MTNPTNPCQTDEDRELIDRLQIAKPPTAGWWMIERDDNGPHRYWGWELPPGSKTWPMGFHIWVTDWQNGARFATKEEAEQARCGDVTLPIREHGMMVEFVNPDGPAAATRLESLLSDKAKLEERVRVLEEALDPFARCPERGKTGDRFVIAKAIYEYDDYTPRGAHWHWDDFQRAAAALNNKSGQSSTRGGESPEPGHMGEDG